MMRKSGIWMGAAFGIALTIATAVLVLGGTDNKSIRLALELTARWSFLLFWLAYAGGALATLFGWGVLAGRGREFGVAFAAAHLQRRRRDRACRGEIVRLHFDFAFAEARGNAAAAARAGP